MGEESTRRRVLASVPATAALLAGCSSDGGEETTTEVGPVPTTEATDRPTQTATETPVGFAESCGGVVEPTGGEASAELLHDRTREDARVLEDTAAAFNEAYGHSITPIVHAASPSYDLQIKRELRSERREPHLIDGSHDAAGRYDESDFLAEGVDDSTVDACQYVDRAWEAAHYDGRLVGLPHAGGTTALYYNRDVVDTPPETVAEMVSIMDGYYDPENGQYGLGIPVNPYFVSGFAQAYGTPIYDGEADALRLASDDVQRGLAVLFDRLCPYMTEDPGARAQSEVFTDGNAAFHVNGPWQLETLRESEVNYGVTTLPSLPDGGTPRPYVGVELLYFSIEMDEQPGSAPAARAFAEWFTTSREWLLAQAERADSVPVHAELVGDDRLPEEIRAFSEQLRGGYPIPQTPKMDQVWGPFGDAVSETFYGGGDGLRANLDSAAEEIRERWAEQELSSSGGVEPPVNPLSFDSTRGCSSF